MSNLSISRQTGDARMRYRPPVLRDDWRALAADDDPDSLLLMTTALQAHGITVQTAVNGEEVIAALAGASTLPTFVVLDISMPKMDGWETLLRIKAQPAWTHLPVLALTAYALESEHERARSAGFNAYLLKPISPSMLLAEIERVVSTTA